MNMSQQNNIRLDYLDAVRSFALILGVFFHASLSFMPIFIGWAVMDISTSDFVSIFILINHSFRMELFFLIAGFFSHMKFHQQGVQNFLKSRLVRIGLPFIISWFLLRPLLVSAWVMGGESMQINSDVNIINGLVAGFASLAELPTGLLVGTHLWFLYYLLVIMVIVILLRLIIGLHEPINRALTQFSDSIILWLFKSPIAIIVLAIPTACCLWFMSHWGMDTPDKSLLPDIPVALIYSGFFFFGWLMHRHSALMENFAQLTWYKSIFAILAIGMSVVLSSFEMKYGDPNYVFVKSGFMFSYAVMMWSLVSITIGICKRLFTRTSKLVRYIADASYWLYLIHLPIVLWLQIAVAELPFHWLVKLISISLITIFISIITYDAFIRSTFIGAMLNGKRKERLIFKLNIESIKQITSAK